MLIWQGSRTVWRGKLDNLASLQHQQARKEVQRSAYFILSTSNTTSEQIVA
ncbi:hypothetical protein M23134_05749 [Microscilla marina ATCC 23134]|uniref:Uncharacterized protein n=1 Tax=Microscilla marina ATCC 23134 TaxID=313606 RepID=A1ZIK8_MICM2|nr:hypothetical protein M23134_05749 [Microscilla marina ATCC 23134]